MMNGARVITNWKPPPIRYKQYIEKHLDPYFRDMGVSVNEITADVIEDYYSYKIDEEEEPKKNLLSVNTVKHHRVVIKSALDMAVRKKMIKHNPMHDTEPLKTEKYKASFYNQSEVNTMLEKAKDEALYPVILVTAFYGLRRSEVLGLKWDAICFEDDTMTIKGVVTEACYNKRVEKDKVKTSSSLRTFPLIPVVKECFKQLREEEQENRACATDSYSDNDYVFKWANGKPFDPNQISAGFRRLLQRYGLRKIRFHDLRHSCASNLIKLGFSLKQVQEWLGHGSIQTTSDIYGHLEFESKKNMSTAIAQSYQPTDQAPTPTPPPTNELETVENTVAALTSNVINFMDKKLNRGNTEPAQQGV